MIRLLILLIFIIGVAAVLGIVYLSRRIDDQQAARARENNYNKIVLCVVCEERVFAEDSDLCLNHRAAMREVDRDTWVPIDDLRTTFEEEA